MVVVWMQTSLLTSSCLDCNEDDILQTMSPNRTKDAEWYPVKVNLFRCILRVRFGSDGRKGRYIVCCTWTFNWRLNDTGYTLVCWRYTEGVHSTDRSILGGAGGLLRIWLLTSLLWVDAGLEAAALLALDKACLCRGEMNNCEKSVGNRNKRCSIRWDEPVSFLWMLARILTSIVIKWEFLLRIWREVNSQMTRPEDSYQKMEIKIWKEKGEGKICRRDCSYWVQWCKRMATTNERIWNDEYSKYCWSAYFHSVELYINRYLEDTCCCGCLITASLYRPLLKRRSSSDRGNMIIITSTERFTLNNKRQLIWGNRMGCFDCCFCCQMADEGRGLS